MLEALLPYMWIIELNSHNLAVKESFVLIWNCYVKKKELQEDKEK